MLLPDGMQEKESVAICLFSLAFRERLHRVSLQKLIDASLDQAAMRKIAAKGVDHVISCFICVYLEQLDQVWADWEVDIMLV